MLSQWRTLCVRLVVWAVPTPTVAPNSNGCAGGGGGGAFEFGAPAVCFIKTKVSIRRPLWVRLGRVCCNGRAGDGSARELAVAAAADALWRRRAQASVIGRKLASCVLDWIARAHKWTTLRALVATDSLVWALALALAAAQRDSSRAAAPPQPQPPTTTRAQSPTRTQTQTPSLVHAPTLAPKLSALAQAKGRPARLSDAGARSEPSVARAQYPRSRSPLAQFTHWRRHWLRACA